MKTEAFKNLYHRFAFSSLPVLLFFMLLLGGFVVRDGCRKHHRESNLAYVDGVIMCADPHHWKGRDFVCYQYQVGSRLYVGAVGRWNLDSWFPGQRCRIRYA